MYGQTYSMDIQEHFYSYGEIAARYVSSNVSEMVTDTVNDVVQPVIPEVLQPTLADPIERLIKEQGKRVIDEAIFGAVQYAFRNLAEKEGVKRTVGKVGTRFLPYVGWALFAKDVYDVTQFVREEFL